MSMITAYPMFLPLAGIVAATLFSQRALALMDADAKSALLDSSSGTRYLSLLVMVIFLALVLRFPLAGWLFLGAAYVALGIRSFFRVRRLSLPSSAARLVMMGNAASVAGIVLCAFIFAARTLR